MDPYAKPGQLILGRYEVLELISSGGQGYLVKGIDRRTSQFVAIKQMVAQTGERGYAAELARFKREGQLRIGHPLVVDPVDFGEEAGQWYIVFPFIDGMTLDEHVAARGGKLVLSETLSIVDQLAEALHAVHGRGIVHRDIKPQNIIITLDGTPRLIDFGIHRNQNQNTITSPDGFNGTPLWVSPEQLLSSGTEDNGSDLFCLGLLMYWLLTGQHPVQGADASAIAKSTIEELPPSPRTLEAAIPQHIDIACMKLLAKGRQDRFASAGEFRQALTGALLQAPAAQRFCPACGAATAAAANYCCGCGAALATEQTSVYCLACGAAADGQAVCPSCCRPFGSVNHRLVGTGGSLWGKTHRIPEGVYDVGRKQLSARDQRISNRHLHVICQNGRVLFCDLNSTNKTYVAGKLADTPVILTENTQVLIAGNTATFISN